MVIQVCLKPLNCLLSIKDVNNVEISTFRRYENHILEITKSETEYENEKYLCLGIKKDNCEKWFKNKAINFNTKL